MKAHTKSSWEPKAGDIVLWNDENYYLIVSGYHSENTDKILLVTLVNNDEDKGKKDKIFLYVETSKDFIKNNSKFITKMPDFREILKKMLPNEKT